MDQNPEDEALNRILGDMDGLESDRMFGGNGANKGVSITISVVPNGDEGSDDKEEYPEGHDVGMCKGGCAYHKGGLVADNMAQGGMVEGKAPTQMPAEAALEDKTLPPFLRKRKKTAPSI